MAKKRPVGTGPRTLTATEVARRLAEVIGHLPSRPTRFTGTDLAESLRKLPPPGEQYLDAVDAGIKSQPLVGEKR